VATLDEADAISEFKISVNSATSSSVNGENFPRRIVPIGKSMPEHCPSPHSVLFHISLRFFKAIARPFIYPRSPA